MAPTSVGERLFETLLITQNLIFPPPSPVCYSFLVSCTVVAVSQLTMEGAKCCPRILQCLFQAAENSLFCFFFPEVPLWWLWWWWWGQPPHRACGCGQLPQEGLGRGRPFLPLSVVFLVKCRSNAPLGIKERTLRLRRAETVGVRSCLSIHVRKGGL